MVQRYMDEYGVGWALCRLRPPRPHDLNALLETDGEYLYARTAPEEPLHPMPLIRLLLEHVGKFPLDFFWGSWRTFSARIGGRPSPRQTAGAATEMSRGSRQN